MAINALSVFLTEYHTPDHLIEEGLKQSRRLFY